MSGVERGGAKDRCPPMRTQPAEQWLEERDEKDLADDGPPADPPRPPPRHLQPRLGILHDYDEVRRSGGEVVGHDVSAVAGTGQQHHPAAAVARTARSGVRRRRIHGPRQCASRNHPTVSRSPSDSGIGRTSGNIRLKRVRSACEWGTSPFRGSRCSTCSASPVMSSSTAINSNNETRDPYARFTGPGSTTRRRTASVRTDATVPTYVKSRVCVPSP